MNARPCSLPATLLALSLSAPILLVLPGCASPPVPVARMAVAEAAVQSANTTNTAADAPAELLIATNKLSSARQAVADKDYERAGRLADEAQLDAQVAELHAQSARARKAAQESRDAARVLLEELNRKTTR